LTLYYSPDKPSIELFSTWYESYSLYSNQLILSIKTFFHKKNTNFLFELLIQEQDYNESFRLLIYTLSIYLDKNDFDFEVVKRFNVFILNTYCKVFQ